MWQIPSTKKTKKTKKSTAFSWSNHLASNGKTLPPTWTGASFSQTDRKGTSLPRGTPTQKQAESRGPRTPLPEKVEDPAKWEKAVLWAGDFSFRTCPIFRVDIIADDHEGVELGPLRCCTKDTNAHTILAASKRPTQLHPTGSDMSALLPPTDKIVWEWRSKKCHAFANDSSNTNSKKRQKSPKTQNISSFYNNPNPSSCRALVLAKRRGVETRALAKSRKRGVSEKALEAEIDALWKYNETKNKIEAKSWEIRATVLDTLEVETQKFSELATDRKWTVLGFRGKEDKYRVVLRHKKEAAGAVWATKGLRKILLEYIDCFPSDGKDRSGRQLFLLVSFSGASKLGELELQVRPPKSFRNWEVKTIVWNLIRC